MRFSDVIGQNTATTQLRRAYAQGRLSHAYIFDGPAGVGKRTTALALAALLLCRSPQEADSCAHCPSCLQLEAGSHPDLLLLQPQGRTIKIKQIRELRLRLASAASYGGYTVVIVEQAESMSIEAANAFLKTVEEPQGEVCFILLTTNAERLPETIRSRTQLVRFKQLGSSSLRRLLGLQADDAAAELVLELAGGSLTRAQALLNDSSLREQSQERARALTELLQSLPTRHDGALLRFADAFMGEREAVREEIILMRRFYERRLRQALAEDRNPSLLIAHLHDTTTALQRLETNTEPAFILGALLIEMARRERR